MQETTLQLIQRVLEADPQVDSRQVKNILDACRTPVKRLKPILAKEAMGILGVSRPTLKKYVREGKLTEHIQSARKIRFDLDEVERLKYNS